MPGLRDLLRQQHTFRQGLPVRFPWLAPLAAITTAGIVTSDPQVRRRQVFVNVGSIAVGLNAASHLVMNMTDHFWPLMPLHIYNLVMMAAMLGLHRLHRHGDNAAAIAFCASVLTGHTYVVLALGLDSGLQIYFTICGLFLFLFGVRQWRLFLLFYGLAFVALIATTQFGPSAGFVMPENTQLREFLTLHGLINTIAINGLGLAYALSALQRAEDEVERQLAVSDSLLHIVLPPSVARRIKLGAETRIADSIDQATILFADLVGFTPAANAVEAPELVGYLDELFCAFDSLCERHGIDKVKTIGDAYMVVGGMDGRAREGAVSIGRFALDMLSVMKEQRPLGGRSLTLRIGVHSGPTVAGVIGNQRVAYDVWGDAVNIAQRMEANGEAGCVTVSAAYRQLAGDAFAFRSRGSVEVKGLGRMELFVLEAA